MSEKRRDSKNRILQNGESQRKDGKYEFKYVDVNGTRRSAYSWKLVATDKVPEGKRCELSLREMEKQIRAEAIDDFVHKVKEHQYVLSDVINSKDYGMFTIGIEQIAEQLKAGGK